MLDSIRRNAQSWMVKAIFAIIVLVFVFWGVGGFQGNKRAVLATVNDVPIKTKEFYRLYERRLESLRQNRPDISSQDLKRMNFKRQLFEQIVNQQLLFEEAIQLGLVVSQDELRSRIKTMEVFQDEQKNFDLEKYKYILQANNLTPASFEQDLRRDLLIEKLRTLITASATADEEEARELFEFAQEKAKMKYILFRWQDYTDQIDLSEQEIKEYYQENKKDFQQPAQIKVRYISLTPEGLASYQKVKEEDIRSYYEMNKNQFTSQERVKVRHILIKLDQDVNQQEVEKAREKILGIRKRLNKGEDFAELAKKYSQGPSAEQGGGLGWITRGDTVEAFEKAAFSLDPGQVSQPVRSAFGFHLINVQEKKEEGIKPLKEVEEQIKKQIATNKASDKLEDLLDQALETLFTSGDLNKSADKLGVELKESDYFTRQQGLGDLDLGSEAMNKLFSLKEKEVTEIPITLNKGYLLAEKTGHKPAHIKPLEEVREKIEDKVKKNKAMDLAEKKATQSLSDLQAGKNPADISLQAKLDVSDPFTRNGFIPGLGRNPDLVNDLFRAKQGSWLSHPFKVQEGFLVASLERRIPPDGDQWQEQKSFWISNINQSRKQELFQAYLQDLRQTANVEISSPDVLKY